MYLLDRHTVRPGSSDPFYIVSYYIKWVTTFWTYSTYGGSITWCPVLYVQEVVTHFM